MDSTLGILTALFLVGGIISTPHLLIIKSELRSNGIWTSYIGFWSFLDLKKFKTLIKNEDNPVKKEEYLTTYYLFLIPFIVMILSFIGSGIYILTK